VKTSPRETRKLRWVIGFSAIDRHGAVGITCLFRVAALGTWCGRRGSTPAGHEPAFFVRAVAERFVFRLAAAAERDGGLIGGDGEGSGAGSHRAVEGVSVVVSIVRGREPVGFALTWPRLERQRLEFFLLQDLVTEDYSAVKFFYTIRGL